MTHVVIGRSSFCCAINKDWILYLALFVVPAYIRAALFPFSPQPFMVFFASHCGVNNAAYYSCQFPSAFHDFQSADASALAPRIFYLDEDTSVRLQSYNNLGAAIPGSEKAVLHAALVPAGPGERSQLFFFSADSRRRTWFLASFPRPWYNVVPSFASARRNGESGRCVAPTSRVYIFYGCPVCGEYQRKYVFRRVASTRPLGDDSPLAYYIDPSELATCARCMVVPPVLGFSGTCVSLQLGEDKYYNVTILSLLMLLSLFPQIHHSASPAMPPAIGRGASPTLSRRSVVGMPSGPPLPLGSGTSFFQTPAYCPDTFGFPNTCPEPWTTNPTPWDASFADHPPPELPPPSQAPDPWTKDDLLQDPDRTLRGTTMMTTPAVLPEFPSSITDPVLPPRPPPSTPDPPPRFFLTPPLPEAPTPDLPPPNPSLALPFSPRPTSPSSATVTQPFRLNSPPAPRNPRWVTSPEPLSPSPSRSLRVEASVVPTPPPLLVITPPEEACDPSEMEVFPPVFPPVLRRSTTTPPLPTLPSADSVEANLLGSGEPDPRFERLLEALGAENVYVVLRSLFPD